MRKTCIFIFLLTLLNASLFSIELYFQSGSTELIEESKQDIELFKQEFKDFFKENPKTLIFVTGHTDDLGSVEENRALSLSRASLIRDYMVNELNIDPKYILTYGRGAYQPIASSDSGTDRNLNRRVEIVFERPEAHISWLQNKVEYIPSISGETQRAKPNVDLFRNDKIKTGEDAKAKIEFHNNNQLFLEENSLLVIYGDISSSFANLLDDTFHVELIYGNLYNTLGNRHDKSLNIKTPAADLQLYSNLNNVEYKNDRTLIYVYEGYGLVTARGRTIRVEAGYGINVPRGSEPDDPVKLPTPPLDFRISDTEPSSQGRRIQLSWKESSPQYLVQIAADQTFQQISLETLLKTAEYQVELPYGKYFTRVLAIAENGLRSDYSAPLPLIISDEEFITCKNLKENTLMKSSREFIILEGTTLDKIKVFINGEETPVSQDLTFSRQIQLKYGINGIHVTALLPDGNEEKYFYRVSFSPPLDKTVVFHNIRSDIINTAEKKKFLLQAEASDLTRMFISGEEITRAENGLFDQLIKLHQGINEITVTVRFIDGSEEDHRFEILYDKQSRGISSLEIIAAIAILLATATPIIVNAILY